MVIVSRGACGTPPVLERSDIGDPKILERVGIKSISELPGVGDGYQDHQAIPAAYKSNLSRGETLDGIVNGDFDIPAMFESNYKLLGWNGMDVICKFRPNDDEAATLEDDFLRVWNRDHRLRPDKTLSISAFVESFPGNPVGIPVGQYFGITPFNVCPLSRGHIHTTDPGLSDALDFDPGIYDDAGNIDIKMSLTIFDHDLTFFGDLQDGTSGGKWRGHETLNVYGVTGLKIADLSIPPSKVGAHTNNTSLTIGEKAANIFIKELGLAQ
ncbi:hypothetical protein DL769_011509 [Monosporascus sp. CRB-8-3]|nr:hypothetical protein DL769_011509 [Monosporascus sp. CRB-8-3]